MLFGGKPHRSLGATDSPFVRACLQVIWQDLASMFQGYGSLTCMDGLSRVPPCPTTTAEWCPPRSYAPTLNVTVFGGRAFTEVIKVNRGHKDGVLIP